MRPHPGAPVSTPVTWAELEGTPPRFNLRTVEQRVRTVGDLFAPMLHLRQDLRRATAAIQGLL